MSERDIVSTATAAGGQSFRLRDILDLTKREIQAGNGYRALQLLRDSNLEAEAVKGTGFYAEHRLRIAEAISGMAAKGDDSAVTYFDDALERIANLPEEEPELLMHARLSYANYLTSALGRNSAARELYSGVKEIAVRLRLEERVAEVQLKMIRIDLEADDDDRLASFENMRVAADGEFTWQQQLGAWALYVGEDQRATKWRRYARGQGVASVKYFRSLLESIRAQSK
jgi:hypothetical protein